MGILWPLQTPSPRLGSASSQEGHSEILPILETNYYCQPMVMGTNSNSPALQGCSQGYVLGPQPSPSGPSLCTLRPSGLPMLSPDTRLPSVGTPARKPGSSPATWLRLCPCPEPPSPQPPDSCGEDSECSCWPYQLRPGSSHPLIEDLRSTSWQCPPATHCGDCALPVMPPYWEVPVSDLRLPTTSGGSSLPTPKSEATLGGSRH